MGVPDYSLFDYSNVIEETLTDNEKLLRNAFVDEYLKDGDPINAALRIGFDFTFAQDFSLKFMREGYVQRRISELRNVNPVENDPDGVLMKVQLTRVDVMERGKDSDKLNACNSLEKAVWVSKGITEGDPTPWQGGVMLVSAIPSVVDWAAAAEHSQADLKKTVRE